MINAEQLRQYVVEPVLRKLQLYSESAVNLVMGTAAAESRMGTYIRQMGGGPALGLYQCEPATHDDIWANYLVYKAELAERIRSMVVNPSSELLMTDLAYSTAICRVHYLRAKGALPAADDWNALAEYWKRAYNTVLGKGTVEHFLVSCYKSGLMGEPARQPYTTADWHFRRD